MSRQHALVIDPHSYPLPAQDDETLRTYDAIHELYDAETVDFWDKFPSDTVNSFAGLLPGKEVLNLGSGPGRDSLILRNHGLNVTCLDGSAKMVEMTSRLGFRSVLADIRNLSFHENSFHGVWAYSSLIHISFEDAGNLVKKIARILKSDGLLFLGLIQGQGNERRSVAGSSFVRYFEYYDQEKIMSLIKNTPFQMIYSDTFKPGNHTYLNYIFRK